MRETMVQTLMSAADEPMSEPRSGSGASSSVCTAMEVGSGSGSGSGASWKRGASSRVRSFPAWRARFAAG